MKRIAVVALALVATVSTLRAQLTLAPDEMAHLIGLAGVTAKNANPEGKQYNDDVEAHRTPLLNHIVEVMQAIGRRDTSLVGPRVLARPADSELQLWYVMRQINRYPDKPAQEVATKALNEKIDSRLLLDNYYKQLNGGIAFLFNDADLSSVNIDIETLGFKSETEKGIFYLDFINALIGARLRVLSMMKNNEGIVNFCSKLPYINRKPYYFFKAFGYKDFEFDLSGKMTNFNENYVGILYNIVLIHWNAVYDLKGSSAAKDIFRNSILSTPEYFKYSGAEGELKKLYNKQK